jgi:predicted lipoprotein with Yx(FWY)xxD motif
MRFVTKVAVPSLAAALLLAACGSSSSGTPKHSNAQPVAHTTSSSPTTVKTVSSPLGMILVDSRGMTLYRLSAEQNGKFICTTASCTGIWHPLTISTGATPGGDVSSLATVKRPDGTTQVTYKGAPLYTFADDQQPGDTKGQGFKDVGTWGAVTVGTSAAPANSSVSAESSSSGSASHY